MLKQKAEIMGFIMDTKCSSKISFQNTLHETFSERNEISIGHEKLNNIVVHSNIATSISALNKSNTSKKHTNNLRLEQNNVMEELLLAVSYTEDTNEIHVNGKQDDGINFFFKFTQNLIEESVNIDKSQNLPL